MIEDQECTVTPAWKVAVETLFSGAYTYGQIVPHAVLQSALELPAPTGRITVAEYESWKLALLTQVGALSAFLLEERNMCLKSAYGDGYEIVMPEKQTGFAMKDGMKRVKSELRRMGRRLSYVDRTALSNEQAKENADAMARLAFLTQQTGKAKRISFAE